MPDDTRPNPNDLSPETIRVLVSEVMGFLLEFAQTGHGGPLTLSPQLARELYSIAGVEDVDGVDTWEQLSIETGFQVGVFATVTCIETLTPGFTERLRERLQAPE